MMTFIRLTLVVLALAVATLCVRSQSGQDQSSREVKGVVEQYCKTASEGRWLGPDHWDELQEWFTTYPQWSSDDGVFVVKDYIVDEPKRQIGADDRVHYEVEVDYLEWGYFDSSLIFRHSGDAAPGEPVKTVQRSSVLLTDKSEKNLWETHKTEEKKGPLRWRMDSWGGLQLQHVTVDTAVRYITEMRSKSNDPIVRDNANRTLTILHGLLAGTYAPVQTTRVAPETPSQVFQRFVKLEKGGEGLTPEGWNSQVVFFALRPGPLWEHVLVIGDDPWTSFEARLSPEGDLAEIGFSCHPVAYLRSSMRLTYAAPGAPRVTPDCCAQDTGYVFRLSDKYWQTEPDGSVKEVMGPLAWRIVEAYPSAPWVTLEVAIHYVTDVRDKATDPVIRANAEKTLASLKHFR
jgi:hypothetical protein